MSAPVISASSSILGFKRNEVFQFQPGATNSPSSWAITSVPSEITIDSSTGLISCTGINIPGPIVFTVTATNGDGAGTKEFVIGISSESAVPSPSTDVGSEWDFDMVTRVLTPLQSTAPAVTGAAAALAILVIGTVPAAIFPIGPAMVAVLRESRCRHDRGCGNRNCQRCQSEPLHTVSP